MNEANKVNSENNSGNTSRGFSYTYSAREQAELKRIRDKYTNKEEDKLERLRKLDRSVANKAQSVSMIFGVIGTLLLGFGMSIIMTSIGAQLGMNQAVAMLVGIPTGTVGGVIASLAYPMYNLVLKREREKIAPEVIRLTDELMKK